jgi:acyl-CoA dehydrogenase
MDFTLTPEQCGIRDTARSFVSTEVLPLEEELLRRQRTSNAGISRQEIRALQLKAREFGFWGPGTPDIVSCFAITEPDAGSDLTALRTRARRRGADWVIDGEKTFITHGTDADLAIVIARTDLADSAMELEAGR